MLNATLFKKTEDLERQIQIHGEDLVAETIVSLITRCLIIGRRVNTWTYFDAAIAEAAMGLKDHDD